MKCKCFNRVLFMRLEIVTRLPGPVEALRKSADVANLNSQIAYTHGCHMR